MKMDDIIVLHSAGRYITFIALENCVEYFVIVQCIGNNTKPIIKRGNELLVFRRFLNAIESLNNIPDYLFHEQNTSNLSLSIFRKNLYEKHIIIADIANIANAYKHCMRGKDLKNKFCPNTDELHAYDLMYDHDVLCRAFAFWSAYANKRSLGPIIRPAKHA